MTSRPVPSPQLFSPPPEPLLPPLHGRENKRKRGREPKNEERSKKRARQQKEKEKQVEEIIELIEKKRLWISLCHSPCLFGIEREVV